jgi:small-conductance mechanosensitive channel
MDWWRPVISGLVGALVVYLLFRLARPVARTEGDRKILEYGRGFRLLAVVFVPVSAFVAYAAAHARPSQSLVAALVALFFVLATAYLLYEAFYVKLGYDQRFIYHYTPLRGERRVPWESVTEAGYSPLFQAHYLATRTQGKIWFSPWLNGFPEFVEYIGQRSELA